MNIRLTNGHLWESIPLAEIHSGPNFLQNRHSRNQTSTNGRGETLLTRLEVIGNHSSAGVLYCIRARKLKERVSRVPSALPIYFHSRFAGHNDLQGGFLFTEYANKTIREFPNVC